MRRVEEMININAELKARPRSSKYGAPMGAPEWRGDPDYAYKFALQRLKFVDYCYSLDGTYWGGPANLYCAWWHQPEGSAHETPEGPEDDVRMFVRASSRQEAKRLVREEYPNAKFFR